MSKRSPALESRRSELIVLLLLMEADRTGYEIRSLIREWNIDRYLPVSPTTIYRALQRLEAEGCLTSQPRQLGRYPVSTVYSITAKGKRRYRGHLLAESVFARTAFSLDPFLGLAAFLDNDTRREVVGEWKQVARKRYEEPRPRAHLRQGVPRVAAARPRARHAQGGAGLDGQVSGDRHDRASPLAAIQRNAPGFRLPRRMALC